jgi:hypothetical protein
LGAAIVKRTGHAFDELKVEQTSIEFTSTNNLSSGWTILYVVVENSSIEGVKTILAAFMSSTCETKEIA